MIFVHPHPSPLAFIYGHSALFSQIASQSQPFFVTMHMN